MPKDDKKPKKDEEPVEEPTEPAEDPGATTQGGKCDDPYDPCNNG